MEADVTRSGDPTDPLRVGALRRAHHAYLPGHCAPATPRLSALAMPALRHLACFQDRIEQMLFDGVPSPRDGAIRIDPSRLGHGFALRATDAELVRVR